jgi:hypothetical protein
MSIQLDNVVGLLHDPQWGHVHGEIGFGQQPGAAEEVAHPALGGQAPIRWG